MLTEAYIEALLVDEELADRVWEAWNVLPASSWNIIPSKEEHISHLEKPLL